MDTTSTKSSRLTSIVVSHVDIIYYMIFCDENVISFTAVSFPLKSYPSLIIRKYSSGILQNTCPGLIKSVRVMKNKERMRVCHRQGETKET